MTVVLLAFAASFSAFVVHLVVWRFRVPRRSVRVLLAIFGLAIVTSLALGWTCLPGFGWGESLYLAALCGAIALTYVLVYTAIEYDSPTLAVAHWLAQGCTAGRDVTEVEAFVRSHPFVQSRLRELEQGGFVARRDGTLIIVERNVLALKVGDLYRRLMGRTTPGG
jgi:hypothetical protein